jgi:hypothetical protein
MLDRLADAKAQKVRRGDLQAWLERKALEYPGH